MTTTGGSNDELGWVKDEFVLRCSSCEVEFGLTTRKHHCRSCGEIFCHDCTTKKLVMGKESEAQRVCEACYTARSVGGGGEPKGPSDPVLEALKSIYRAGIKPLERQFKFDGFYSPLLSDADFDSPPMVMLMGAYSVGKTSFIQHLLGRAYPGARVGPEPSTDRFIIVSRSPSNQDRVIPGNALVVQSDRPFRSLSKFGGGFLGKLECAEVRLEEDTEDQGRESDDNPVGARGGGDKGNNHDRAHKGMMIRGEGKRGVVRPGSILRHISFVDTPGILSGEKQRLGRAFDFTAVCDWFAGRVDRILLLFDAHKLDISDEFRQALEALRGHDDKIRVVLNKADSVDAQQLMRVHGALMWSLGKVIRTPEVVRVYVGSFWDEPVQNKAFEDLFKWEERDLVADLESLPASAVLRKINEVVKRARAAKLHALIIDHLRNQLPYFGKEAALERLLQNLGSEFRAVSRAHSIPMGDFPNPDTFRRQFEINCGLDMSGFPPLNPNLINLLNEIMAAHIPRVVALHNQRAVTSAEEGRKASVLQKMANPFGGSTKLEDEITPQWDLPPEEFERAKAEFDAQPALDPEGKLGGTAVRPLLMASGLPQSTLRKIFSLSDVDRDGKFDVFEYALARHFVVQCLAGEALPEILPPGLRPPQR